VTSPSEVVGEASTDAPRSPTAVGDRLAESVLARRSQLVLGLDPDPARLWPRALELAAADEGGGRAGGEGPGGTDDQAHRAGRAVVAHCQLLVDAAGPHCVAVKPQVACFERLGAPGWAALAEVIAHARRRGLIVIADAKRGDIDVSAHAYGEAFFGGRPGSVGPFGVLPGLGVDWLTASPLLGRDSLAALLQEARRGGGGLMTLVRTSNPGAGDLQDLPLADGRSVSDAIAGLVHGLGETGVGSAGLADVGAVVGATAPEHLKRLRRAMPHAPMLLPGLGPQGATGEGLAPAFEPGPAGGLVAASRAIADAFHARGGDPAEAARAEAQALRERIWDLYG
jgi:orotidine-5'-phosphate decarboxylase